MSKFLTIVCDVCHLETRVESDWNYADREPSRMDVLNTKIGSFNIYVGAVLGKEEHVCKYCLIEAVNALDDRPRHASTTTERAE